MTIIEIYNLAIKMGIESDFRERKVIEDNLNRLKRRYDKMSDDEKEEFDLEKLKNPFSDTRILFEGLQKNKKSLKKIKKILVGVDIDGEELLLADKLGDIDLVISHHPRGKALAGLDDVMDLQIDVLAQYGVPINVAEKLLKKRIDEVARGISSANHNRPIDIAKILNLPFLCIHTPCDNLAAQFINQKLKKDNPIFLREVVDSLKEVPEYQESIKIGAGPKIFVGTPESRVGKLVITEITGGTEGSAGIYEKLVQVGAGTVIGMHISEKNREEAEKANINVVIAGHISSDSLGINLFLDKIEKQGIKIIPCSGLIRVSRN